MSHLICIYTICKYISFSVLLSAILVAPVLLISKSIRKRTNLAKYTFLGEYYGEKYQRKLIFYIYTDKAMTFKDSANDLLK